MSNCAMPETPPWVVRPFEVEDEACVVSMWLRSYAESLEVGNWLEDRGLDRSMPRRWFASTTTPADRREELYYWRFFQPMVVGLVRGCETRVLCDPERVHTTADSLSGIMAWACVSPGIVHYVGIHGEAKRAGRDIAAEMVADLLHDCLDGPMVYTFELRELQRMHLKPANWRYDGRWVAGMRNLSLFARSHQRATDAASVIATEVMRARTEKAA